MAEPAADAPLASTPLHALHIELGARMVPFAGYSMPVQYQGVIAEHQHTREKAGLFDVSHMGQARVRGDEAALEALISADLSALKPGAQKYALLLNDRGGIMDDLMVSRPDGDGVFMVVNAAVKENDFAHMRANFGAGAELAELPDRALLALQGPMAAAVMADTGFDIGAMAFMNAIALTRNGVDFLISRSGYTGEDGFEISLPADQAEAFARELLADGRVAPIGLGARDSLRLEAGLCLYGHDMDEETSPVEAALTWAVAKTRRERRDLPGAARILAEIETGPSRKRFGFVMADKAPAREGAEIAVAGEVKGRVTSGGFGPTLGKPVGMGYLPPEYAKPGQSIEIIVRGKPRPAEIVSMPFAPHRFFRG